MENALWSPKSTSKNVVFLFYLARILELREASSTLAHPELLSSLMACFQQDLQSGILRWFQIKCLIHGDTSTNKALGKAGRKVVYNTTGWKGKAKPGAASTQDTAMLQLSPVQWGRRSSSHPLGTALQAGSWGITNLLSWRGRKKKRACCTPALCDCAIPPPSIQHSGFNFPACSPCAILWQQWQMCITNVHFYAQNYGNFLSLMQCSKDICNITLEMTGPWRQGFFS